MSKSQVSVGRVLQSLLPGVLFSLLFAAAGVVHVTGRVLVVDAGYRVGQLESEGRKLEREHARLLLERNHLRSPQRLERLAREQLGMAPPPPGAVVQVPSAPAATAASSSAPGGGGGTALAARGAP